MLDRWRHNCVKQTIWKQMNSRASILLVSVGCILFARSLVAQMETFVPANDVSFSLSTERKSYRTGEQINSQYRIKNISNGPLCAPREWEAKCPGNRHVWVWFENSTGEHFMPGWGSCDRDDNPKTVIERMTREAVLLKPGEHMDGTLQLDTRLFGGLRPGKYRIEGVLYCWR